jgi:DNA-binding SARP family transcriptional activator
MATLPRLQLLGPPQALHADGRSVGLAAREAALLARLWLDGPCPRSAMAGFLWPRADEQRARANLRQTLLRLKRDVGAVLTESDGVLALAAEAAPGEPPPSAASAAAPLLGPIEFDDAPELAEWLAERRARVQRDRLREGLRSAQQALQAGRTDEALAAADALLASDPAVEEAHRVRMQVFLARGDRAAAIGAWDECTDALRRAFGIAPSAATQALGRAALSGDGPREPARGAAPDSDRPPLAVSPPVRPPGAFVGRAAALSRLDDALAAGHAVLVVGPGGMGKSRLLAERLPAGAQTVWVCARPGDALLGGVWVARLVAAVFDGGDAGGPRLHDEALRRSLRGFLRREDGDDIAEARRADGVPAASAQEHRHRIAALATLLRQLHQSGIRHLVVDDLQWMDPLSLEALGAALHDWGPGLAETLPLPVLACRSGALSPSAQRLLDALQGSGRTVRVELSPLAPADLVPWLHTSPQPEALAAALHARVGGNPAFLQDALRALQRRSGPAWHPGEPLPLPANLVDSVRARLAELPPTALQLAQLAAVAGGDFSLSLAAAACGCAPLALAPHFRALEDADVLSASGFLHDLVEEAVSATLPETLRKPLHGLVADHLAAKGGSLVRLAHHRRAAGQTAEAADAFRRAADAARHGWRMAEAAEALEAEAALRTEAERPRRLLAWGDAARCWLNQGEATRAAAALVRAESLVQDASDRLRVLATRCTLHLNTGDSAALGVDGPALAQTLLPQEAALDDDELAHALLGMATAGPYVDAPETLLVAIEAMTPRAEASPRLEARLALCAGIVLNWLGWPARARARLQQGNALAEAHGLHSERVNLGNQLARCDEGEGDLDAAIRRCLQTERIVRELGLGANFEADLANLRGLYEARSGRGDRAFEAFDDARRRLGARGQTSPYMQLREARAHAWLGDANKARRLVEPLLQPAQDAPPSPHGAFVAWTLAVLDHQAGRPAATWLRQAAPACRGTGTLMALRHHAMCVALGAPQEAGTVRNGLPDALSSGPLVEALQARALHGLAAALGGGHSGRRDPWLG